MLIILLIISNQISLSQTLSNYPDNLGDLTVRITGFANDSGYCWFALDNSEDVYESKDSVFIGKVLPIVDNEVVIRIESLTYGYYAVKVFHDENSNEEIDTNILGIPTENYGYSNNASAWFGPPSWDSAKFLLNKNYVTMEISVD